MTGKPYRLPTEQEWERAARGIKGREYAWGDEFDKDSLNNQDFWGKFDFDVMSTTVVGQFKDGNTPDGISGLSGNVWEWTASWYETEQTSRVLRGGSWLNTRRNVRCANRLGLVPVYFNLNVGFRLVSPGS